MTVVFATACADGGAVGSAVASVCSSIGARFFYISSAMASVACDLAAVAVPDVSHTTANGATPATDPRIARELTRTLRGAGGTRVVGVANAARGLPDPATLGLDRILSYPLGGVPPAALTTPDDFLIALRGGAQARPSSDKAAAITRSSRPRGRVVVPPLSLRRSGDEETANRSTDRRTPMHVRTYQRQAAPGFSLTSEDYANACPPHHRRQIRCKMPPQSACSVEVPGRVRG